jgi:hypothetical protein
MEYDGNYGKLKMKITSSFTLLHSLKEHTAHISVLSYGNNYLVCVWFDSDKKLF